jgi:hypothetical protein
MSTASRTNNDNKELRRQDLKRQAARQRYVEIGVQVLLEQVRDAARKADKVPTAIGPFTLLDSNVAAARDRKTRGSISNLFGSQAAFQTETMALALSAGRWIEEIRYPPTEDYKSSEAWARAFFESQSARGPQHAAAPTVNYGAMWALWLGTLPYGVWSESVSSPSLAEHVQWVKNLEGILERVLVHFKVELAQGVTLNALASAIAHLIEGAWLNQCLTRSHPFDAHRPASDALVSAGLILWRGAVQPVR